MCWSSVPPRATLSTCTPRQMASVGTPIARAACTRASSPASRSPVHARSPRDGRGRRNGSGNAMAPPPISSSPSHRARSSLASSSLQPTGSTITSCPPPRCTPSTLGDGVATSAFSPSRNAGRAATGAAGYENLRAAAHASCPGRCDWSPSSADRSASSSRATPHVALQRRHGRAPPSPTVGAARRFLRQPGLEEAEPVLGISGRGHQAGMGVDPCLQRGPALVVGSVRIVVRVGRPASCDLVTSMRICDAVRSSLLPCWAMAQHWSTASSMRPATARSCSWMAPSWRSGHQLAVAPRRAHRAADQLPPRFADGERVDGTAVRTGAAGLSDHHDEGSDCMIVNCARRSSNQPMPKLKSRSRLVESGRARPGCGRRSR